MGGTLERAANGSVVELFANGAATAAFASLVSSAASSARQANLNKKYESLMSSTDPADRQSAVDLAIDEFNIDTDGIDSIEYSSEVPVGVDADTTLYGDGSIDVRIGDGAFEGSFGRLGSTIGHEAFHSRFHMALGATSELTTRQEIEALQWELNQRDRFGLTSGDVRTLQDRLNFRQGKLQIQIPREQQMQRDLENRLEFSY